MTLIKEVSDLTKEPWGIVWQMGIYEFFNYLAFSRQYNQRQQELINKKYNTKSY